MKLIYFFDEHIKPVFMRGKGIVNPENTGIIGNGISCVREYDVNLWFYTKGGTILAFDAGHLNFKNIGRELRKIGIKKEEIKHLFLTHVDVDHAGGADPSGKLVFPNGQVYLGEREEAYLTGKVPRFRRFGMKINNSVKLKKGYRLLKDKEVIQIDGIKVQVFYILGHTLGHCCYLIDDEILISGDCLAVNEEGGYSFFDFFTQDPALNKKFLKRLEQLAMEKEIKMICTGHSGCHRKVKEVFSHIEESAKFSRREPFDKNAPFDPFAFRK